mgnify:CR=1|jgi:hypothetical protein
MKRAPLSFALSPRTRTQIAASCEDETMMMYYCSTFCAFIGVRVVRAKKEEEAFVLFFSLKTPI